MSEDATMNMNEFETALGKWGTDLSRWPEADRAAGQDAMTRLPDAAAAYSEMATVERELMLLRADEAASPINIPADLAARILADAAEAMPTQANPVRSEYRPMTLLGRIRGFFSEGPGMWRPVTACAASAVIGLWLGTSAPAAVAEAAVAMVASEAAMEFAMLDTDDMASMELDWDEFETEGGE